MHEMHQTKTPSGYFINKEPDHFQVRLDDARRRESELSAYETLVGMKLVAVIGICATVTLIMEWQEVTPPIVESIVSLINSAIGLF